MVLFLEQPLNFEGKEKDRLDIEIFNFDKTLAPSGKTVIKVNFDSNYDYWKNYLQTLKITESQAAIS